MKIKKIIFKKITFINIKNLQFKNILSKKGVYLFPSGPGLSSLNYDTKYSKSLKEADYVFFDSGYFVLLLRLFKSLKVNKFSGFKFLEYFFRYLSKNKDKIIFSIDPDLNQSEFNRKYFDKIGVKKVFSYIAPIYKKSNIVDKKLINQIKKVKPNYILTNIAGGKQEILGLYLKNNLNFKTSIYCTGGAISFFTGLQPPVNKLFDYLYLGWLIRIIFKPRLFLIRYLSAFKLIIKVYSEKISIK